MSVRLTNTKRQDIVRLCKNLRSNGTSSIQDEALIGKLVAAFAGVQYGPLHYRELEKNKIEALRAL